jgi:hypothetical protein
MLPSKAWWGEGESGRRIGRSKAAYCDPTLKLPKNPFRENREHRIASEVAKLESGRAEAQFRILQEQADKADAQRQSEEHHRKIERHTWRKQSFLGHAQLKAARRLNCITTVTPVVIAIVGVIGGIAAVLSTRTATIESNRAWMGLDAAIAIDGFKAKPEGDLSAHYVIKNFGKGPALNVVSTSAVDTNPEVMGERGKTICTLAETISSGSEAPKQFIRSNNPGPLGRILFPDQIAQEPITEEGAGVGIGIWHGGSIQGAKSIWVLGCIAYIDQFKGRHWTRFCI